MNNKNKPSYYAILPANVRYDNRLKANEKIMYAEITALSESTGKCWASNNYFAELYEVTPQAISKWIKNIEKSGYINTSYIYKEGTKMIEKRYISIVPTNVPKVSTHVDGGINHSLGGYQHTIKDNITSIEYYKINNKPYSPLEAFDLFWNLYPKKNGKKPSSEKFLKLIEKSPELAEVIINDLTARKQTTTWTKDNGKYVPNATTYLNQERWQDELELPQHSELKLKHKQY